MVSGGSDFNWASVLGTIGKIAQDGRTGAHYQEVDEDIDDQSDSSPVTESFEAPISGIESPEALEEALQRASLSYFASRVLRGDPSPPYNGHFLVSEHHEEWSDLVASTNRLCCLAPRDHGKTYFFDFAYPIWMAWRHPNRSGFIFSATKPQAERILQDIREEIEANPRLAHLIPEKRERWNNTELRLANGHTIYARGFGTKVRGAHPVWIVCDDVLNDETAYSETQRKKQNDYFFSAIVPMCVPGGTIIVVGTPFHSLDLYAEIASKEAWKFRRYQALWKEKDPETGRATGPEKALWPERYSLEYLYWKRDKDVGSIRFAREYLCQPISDDMSLFPSWLFQGKPVEQPNLRLGMPLEFWRKMDLSIYMGVDFAISATQGADYTVVFVMGLDPRGNRWILDIARYHGLGFIAQKSKIIAMAKMWDPDLIFLEANAMQQIFGQDLIYETDLPIRPYTTGSEKHSLEKGLPSIRTLLENGKFRIPRGDSHSVEMTELMISELNSFTFDGGKVISVGEHDDIAMALWICDQAIRAGAAFTATFGVEDTLTPREMKKAKAGDLKLDPPSEIIKKQMGLSGEEDQLETDPFTGEPINRDGTLKSWQPNQGAPAPSLLGGWGVGGF